MSTTRPRQPQKVSSPYQLPNHKPNRPVQRSIMSNQHNESTNTNAKVPKHPRIGTPPQPNTIHIRRFPRPVNSNANHQEQVQPKYHETQQATNHQTHQNQPKRRHPTQRHRIQHQSHGNRQSTPTLRHHQRPQQYNPRVTSNLQTNSNPSTHRPERPNQSQHRSNRQTQHIRIQSPRPPDQQHSPRSSRQTITKLAQATHAHQLTSPRHKTIQTDNYHANTAQTLQHLQPKQQVKSPLHRLQRHPGHQKMHKRANKDNPSTPKGQHKDTTQAKPLSNQSRQDRNLPNHRYRAQHPRPYNYQQQSNQRPKNHTMQSAIQTISRQRNKTRQNIQHHQPTIQVQERIHRQPYINQSTNKQPTNRPHRQYLRIRSIRRLRQYPTPTNNILQKQTDTPNDTSKSLQKAPKSQPALDLSTTRSVYHARQLT